MTFFNVFFKTLGFFIGVTTFIFLIGILTIFLPENKSSLKFIQGDKNSSNIIVTLNLNGPIINNLNKTFMGNIIDYIDPNIIKNYLSILDDIKPKILIIKMNSPGGTVVASSSLEKIIKDFKNKNRTIVYFYTNEILTSGGYWVATSGNKIFASYGSLIGNIGVRGPSWYYYDNPTAISSGLFGSKIETKNGIQVFDQTVGSSKDLYNPFRKPKEKELKHLKNLIEDIYEDFIFKVSKSRKIEISILKKDIGALIFNANQAKKNFLIDEEIEYDQLIENILKDNKFEDYKILEINTKDNFVISFFESFFDKNETLICNKLRSNFVSILPIFFSTC